MSLEKCVKYEVFQYSFKYVDYNIALLCGSTVTTYLSFCRSTAIIWMCYPYGLLP